MEGYITLFDRHLSTVWSAPNYCYRCGNQASILEVGPGGSMFFNVFDAAPENDRDGPAQQAQQNASGRVCFTLMPLSSQLTLSPSCQSISCNLTPTASSHIFRKRIYPSHAANFGVCCDQMASSAVYYTIKLCDHECIEDLSHVNHLKTGSRRRDFTSKNAIDTQRAKIICECQRFHQRKTSVRSKSLFRRRPWWSAGTFRPEGDVVAG